MNLGDLQALSAVRLNEAKALLKADFPSGAWYLAGYAVECGLKACIAKQVQRYDFPDRDLCGICIFMTSQNSSEKPDSGTH